MILVAGALLAAALGARWSRAGCACPGLVLFLGLGMVVGSDGFGWIDFNDYELARTSGSSRSRLILFEGGLATGWPEIRPVLGAALSLAIVGTILIAVITGLGGGVLFDFEPLQGLLLGAIVAATDGAAIFAVLRGSTLRRRLARTLEGEAGINDPVAVLLVIGFIDWIQQPRLRHRWTWRWLFVRGAGDRRRGRHRRRRARGLGAAARAARVGRPVPGRVAGVRRDGVRRRGRRCTAPASSPSTSRAW